jgi:methyl-accepting chemotaxis protein
MSSLRTRILIISSATVIGALALSGAATYSIVRSNTMESIEQNLAAVASGNTLAINKWVEAKAQAVKATAEVVEHGDPQGFGKHMGNANGFPIITIAQGLRPDGAPLVQVGHCCRQADRHQAVW